MHTTELETCRIHHNGGYDGNVIITNLDSTSRVVDEGCKGELKIDVNDLIKFVADIKRQQIEAEGEDEYDDDDTPQTILGIHPFSEK